MRSSMGVAAVVAITLASGAAAFGPAGHAAAPAPTVHWGPAPPFFPAGARFAVLQGNPGASGVYTVRLEFPAGYKIQPHFHPTDENVTVLSGSFMVGMGDTLETRDAMVLGPEGFITAPAQAHHFAMARRKTIIQVHGEGPFAITYVNPADDPRNATPSR